MEGMLHRERNTLKATGVFLSEHRLGDPVADNVCLGLGTLDVYSMLP
jgi:hypothetical protein